jgi:serine/threonine protein kinase
VYKRQEHESAPGRAVVVKVMQQKDFGSYGDPRFHDAAARFLDEAKLSSSYSHVPFLVTALDWSEDPWPAIVYPVVEGETVTARAKRQPIAGRDWWNLAHDSLSALYQVHKDNLIHQDIKPDNIMITTEKAVSLDFGLAYVSGYFGNSTNYGGTLVFMAPEMLTRKSADDYEHLTTAADLYALGLVLYWARTRTYSWLPQEEKSLEALLAGHLALRIEEDAFDSDEMALLRALLKFEPSKRITAREGLELVAAKVDVESKTLLYEALELEAMAHKGDEPVPVDEKVANSSVKGPFASWAKFEETVATTSQNKRPRIAIFDLVLNGRENLYCQIYREAAGWSLECMSDTFTDLAHSRRVRTNFINLGWTPPSGSSPNYQRYVLIEDAKKIPSILMDAMALGYELKAADVKKIKVTQMGENYDGKILR